MLDQAYAVSAIVGITAAGLTASNVLVDRGVDRDLSRRVPGILGWTAFLIAVLWLEPWTAVAAAGALTLCILVLRVGFRLGLRGVRDRLPVQA